LEVITSLTALFDKATVAASSEITELARISKIEMSFIDMKSAVIVGFMV
jgi:hypothetical protein